VTLPDSSATTLNRCLVIVTTSFPIRGDGSEAAGSFVADLVVGLARHIQVRVVAPGPSATREHWSQGVEVFRFAAPPRPLSTLKPWRLDDFRWLVRVLRGGPIAAREAVAGVQGSILALWGLPCGDWARRVGKKSRMHYSVWLLGSDVWTLGRIPVFRQMLARVIRGAAHVYADGYQLATDAQNIGGVPVAFLPSTRELGSVDPPQVHAAKPFRLLFLGRWHPNKGIDLLLSALAELSDEDWSRIEVLEIQGGGPLESVVRAGVAALRARNRPVEIGCFLSKSEAEAAIARSDWILIPSRIESIPVVFSDAVKFGRPVIATPVGDLPRLLVKHQCGVLSATVDSKSFAAALRVALGKSPLDYLSGVRSVAPMFSIQAVVDRLLQDGVR
jgi:glycosyltransferase involved in cell wall biosynthesis